MDDGRPPKSLYDEFEGTYAAVAREEILISVVVVSKFGPHISDKDLVTKFILSLLPPLSPPYNVTGIVLIYPNHAITILEAPIRSILTVLEGLNNSEIILKKALLHFINSKALSLDDSTVDEDSFESLSDSEIIKRTIQTPEKCPILQSRILTCLHDIPFRIFRGFEIKVFDMTSIPVPEVIEPEEDEKKLIELLQQLTRLSIYLAYSAMQDQEEYVPEIYKLKMSKLLTSLRDLHPELVPPQADLAYFAEVTKMDGIITLSDYLARFNQPDTLTSECNETWPIPKNAFLYQ